MFQTLKFIPSKIFIIDGEAFGIFMFALAGLFWFLIPFWDRKTKSGERRYSITYLGVFVVIFIIVMSIIGYVT